MDAIVPVVVVVVAGAGKCVATVVVVAGTSVAVAVAGVVVVTAAGLVDTGLGFCHVCGECCPIRNRWSANGRFPAFAACSFAIAVVPMMLTTMNTPIQTTQRLPLRMEVLSTGQRSSLSSFMMPISDADKMPGKMVQIGWMTFISYELNANDNDPDQAIEEVAVCLLK